MTTRRHWSDAAAAVTRLARHPADRRTLLLLARLPLAPERVIEQLAGLRGGASVYRCLSRLVETGLIATIRPPLHAGHVARLWYLTDLGLATVALDQRVAVEHLARRNRLRDADLLALLPGLPQLLATYDLLAALAASRPGRPNLLAWERPWRRRYWRPMAKAPVTATLPAHAAFAWEEEAASCLMLPDLATFPLHVWRVALDRLLMLRGLDGDVPMLVIATTNPGRAAGWRMLLEETRQWRAEAPIAACVATWDNLRESLASLPLDGDRGDQRAEYMVRRVRVRLGWSHQPTSPLPRLVGETLAVRTAVPQVFGGLGRIALRLSAADRALLDLVGRHPFLTQEGLATVMGSSARATRRRSDRLIGLGLLRVLGPEEAVADAGVELVELTAAGLALLAAQQGLTLGAAVRANGLAGGGLDQPIGARRSLLKHPAHTLGADACFVDLAATARRLRMGGSDDALVEWRNAAACSCRHFRPDGYGVYRHDGRLYGFFLEFDRGTMSARDYREKFAAYYTYWVSGRFERDYDGGLPTILVVTAGPASEARIAKALRAVGVGRQPCLPV
ncbi:MAG: replication-relaxation family protein, partial [Dehalococcoidia bacterium]